jgi:predicted ATPase/DNA-binding SARP family transcriptional activator
VLCCGVLGSTEVEADGVRLELGGPRPRRLLAALVAAEGQLVPDAELTETLWGESPPARPLAVLQVHVSRLRATLGSRRDLIERDGAGYRLRLPSDAVDAERFAVAVERGRALLAGGDPGAAVDTLTEALGLWRGEPFADLPGSVTVEAARSRLRELREVAVEERLAARLATGDAALTVTELEPAVHASPYRERRWALLILGLYRTGRQGEALATLRRVRALLADELGVDPGTELQQLERRVLGQDPRLLLPEPAPTPEPARSRSAGRPLSSFLGRDRELRSLAALLDSHRLVTVVGPAGVGKTRLVVEHLAEPHVTEPHPTQPHPTGDLAGDGRWLVRLADLSQPELLAQAVLDALGLAEVTGAPRTTLVRALTARPGLLVLDNCEHLTEAAADLAVELLGRCPGLRILATSREQLGVDGEAVLTVAPLPLDAAPSAGDLDGPDGPDGPDGGESAAGPAVRLLLDRVWAVRPGWTPSAEDLAHARRISAALDGLPLALELAAARAKILGLAEIADRLGDNLALLGPVPRGSVNPHATLLAAVSWSVEQLTEADRALLLRLWPFEGGFSLDAVEAVWGTGTPPLESLSTLVARSLVSADTTTAPARYRLLETLRAYCREHDPDPAGSAERHAQWVRELVARNEGQLTTGRAGHAVRVLAAELPNLRAGINHDLGHEPAAALRTVGRLHWFWLRGGHLAEGREQAEAALLAAPDAPTLDRGRAHLVLAGLHALADDIAAQQRRFDAVCALADTSTDREHRLLRARALYQYATALLSHRVAGPALAAAEQSVTLGRQLGEDWVVAAAQMVLGSALILRGDRAGGERNLDEAAELATRCEVHWITGRARMFQAWAVLRGPGDPLDRGRRTLELAIQSLELYEHDGDHLHSLGVLHTVVAALNLLGRRDEARRLHAAVFQHSAPLGLPPEHLRRIAAIFGDLVPELPEDAADGPRLSWAEMITLARTGDRVELARS